MLIHGLTKWTLSKYFHHQIVDFGGKNLHLSFKWGSCEWTQASTGGLVNGRRGMKRGSWGLHIPIPLFQVSAPPRMHIHWVLDKKLLFLPVFLYKHHMHLWIQVPPPPGLNFRIRRSVVIQRTPNGNSNWKHWGFSKDLKCIQSVLGIYELKHWDF